MVSTRSSSRAKQSASPERISSPASPDPGATRKDDLAPPIPKEGRGIRTDVKKPLEQVRLVTFIHILICVLLVCLAWYIYRTAFVAVEAFRSTSASPFSSTSFSLHTNPIWRFVSRQFGRDVRGSYDRRPGTPHLDVERHIEELADALGVHPLDFANAIGDAVRQSVPLASLSSLASEAKKTGGGRIIDVLLGKYAHDVHIADGVAGRVR